MKKLTVAGFARLNAALVGKVGFGVPYVTIFGGIITLNAFIFLARTKVW
jgi:hypothetical protein